MRLIPKKIGLLGYPLKKTFSPLIFDFLFKKYGINNTYRVLKIKPKSLKSFLKKEKDESFFNITSPHKEKTFILCSKSDKISKGIKAVNAVKITKGKKTGYNFDVLGFKDSLEDIGISKNIKTAAVISTGGAAKAAIYALCLLKTKEILIFSRKKSKAENMAKMFKKIFPKINFFSRQTGVDIEEADLLINAAKSDSLVLLKIKNAAKTFFYDINYDRKTTTFLKTAKKIGAKHLTDGKLMLFYQAIKSFETATGIKITKRKTKLLKKDFFTKYFKRDKIRSLRREKC